MQIRLNLGLVQALQVDQFRLEIVDPYHRLALQFLDRGLERFVSHLERVLHNQRIYQA